MKHKNHPELKILMQNLKKHKMLNKKTSRFYLPIERAIELLPVTSMISKALIADKVVYKVQFIDKETPEYFEVCDSDLLVCLFKALNHCLNNNIMIHKNQDFTGFFDGMDKHRNRSRNSLT